MKTKELTKQMVEASVMIALATVLSIFKMVEMPYGGSVTLASMLPIVVISYRHGVKSGLCTGVVFAAVQQLLGLNNLSYFTTWQSIVAVMLLDYFIAFTVLGLGGIFKNKIGFNKSSLPQKQKVEMTCGMLFVCILRFACHTIGGATVWAGLSIPTEAALVYSIGYNLTYMIPETVISVLVCSWIAEIFDFSKNVPTRFVGISCVKEDKTAVACEISPRIANLILIFALCFDTLMIAPYLQDSSSGAFTFSNLGEVNWIAIAIVSGVALVSFIAFRVYTYAWSKKINSKFE